MSDQLRDAAFECVNIFRLQAMIAKRDGDENALWVAREARFRWTQILEFAGAGYLTPQAVELFLTTSSCIIEAWEEE